MKKFSALLLAFMLCSALQMLVAANQFVIKPEGKTEFQVNFTSFDHLRVTQTIGDMQAIAVNTDRGNFVELLVAGFSKSRQTGAPELPVMSKLIEIPQGATAQVNVLASEYTELDLAQCGLSGKLFPMQPPQPKSGNPIPFVIDQAAYSTNTFFGGPLAKVEVSGTMRGMRVANLVLSPLQYNPVTNQLRVYTRLVVDVVFAGANAQATSELKARTRTPYFDYVYGQALNSDNITDTMSKMPVKFVIVSDPMFQAQLQPFIQWKTKRGFKVIEAYTNNGAVGNTFLSIKNYLQGLYTSATPNDPAPTFVLFVGDVDQIPSYNCGDHYSDLYYCEYTGDYLPEMYYGRFSANNVAQLQPQIDKTLQYEQYLMPDPSFLNTVTMVAGADASHQLTWGNGQINYGTTYYYNAAHNLTSHTYLQPEPGGGNYAQNIHTDVSNGVAYANYTAHGSPDGWADPSFTISDISNLQNANKYCLMVGNCCQTSTFNGVTFGEEIVRAANKGALGYIGASDYSYWDEDYWWGVGVGQIVSNPTYETTGLGAYDRTFHDHGEPREQWYSTMDQMVIAGLLAVQESNSGMKQYYWEIYCLMGDPSTMVYFSVPPAMSVQHAPLLPLGTNIFEVTTEPYAYVALTQGNEIHGVAEANAQGLASLVITPFNLPGYANLVITKQNRKPYIDSVLVASPEGPYLILDNYLIKDAGGNNNQQPEFNEPLTLDMEYDNYGNSNAINAVSVISSTNPYISYINNSHTWPIIASQGSGSAIDAFTIHVDQGISDMANVPLTITTTADNNVFTDQLSMVVHAPKLSHANIITDDATSGNGNGQMDPGETIYLNLEVSNIGHCTSQEVISQLLAFNSQYITVLGQPQNLGPLTPGQAASLSLAFSISPNAPIGTQFSLYITSSAGYYNALSSLNLQVGPLLEDFETADFSKFAWRFKADKPWVISTNNTHNSSGYCAKSGAIANGQKSEMYMDAQVLFDDTIAFYRKVSTQSAHDYLRFLVDGVELGSWSGIKDYMRVSFPVSAGAHRFSWVYDKDATTIGGSDVVWVDDIEFPTMSSQSSGPLSLNVVALPEVICPGGFSQLYALPSGGNGSYNYSWSPATGLNATNVFNPIATPDQTTLYQIDVTSGFLSTSGTVQVTVGPAPAAPTITQTASQLSSSSATGNQWYDYYGKISGATQQTFTPQHTGQYYCTFTNASGCESGPSNKIVVAFTGVPVSPALAAFIYPNPCGAHCTLCLSLPGPGEVTADWYNALGTKVLSSGKLFDREGSNEIQFDLSALPSGVYTCRIGSSYGSVSLKVVKQ